jgi:hypothetical protein
MHMHLSRQYLTRMQPSHSNNDTFNAVIDGLASLILQHAAARISAPNVFMHLTGRRSPSDYASITESNRNARFRHINWGNHATVEFRFPGPHGFQNPSWPCVIHDICLAMVDTAALLLRTPYASLSQPSQGLRDRIMCGSVYGSSTAPLRARAMCCMLRVIAAAPDQYPFAFAHIFATPNAPSLGDI